MTKVKSLDLADTRVVTFATHGLVAGDLPALAEPALALTPPSVPTKEDDGLLRASDVSQLKLNADWVLLSGCNTAAADGTPGAEGLSGLAKAFFYAGARSLLVSHWPVDSAATVKLTTSAFRILEKAPAIGRAEAFRRAMLAMVDGAGKSEILPTKPILSIGRLSSSSAKAEAENEHAWRCALTVLPAISSLSSLRRFTEVHHPGNPFVGFGDDVGGGKTENV